MVLASCSPEQRKGVRLAWYLQRLVAVGVVEVQPRMVEEEVVEAVVQVVSRELHSLFVVAHKPSPTRSQSHR